MLDRSHQPLLDLRTLGLDRIRVLDRSHQPLLDLRTLGLDRIRVLECLVQPHLEIGERLERAGQPLFGRLSERLHLVGVHGGRRGRLGELPYHVFLFCDTGGQAVEITVDPERERQGIRRGHRCRSHLDGEECRVVGVDGDPVTAKIRCDLGYEHGRRIRVQRSHGEVGLGDVVVGECRNALHPAHRHRLRPGRQDERDPSRSVDPVPVAWEGLQSLTPSIRRGRDRTDRQGRGTIFPLGEISNRGAIFGDGEKHNDLRGQGPRSKPGLTEKMLGRLESTP